MAPAVANEVESTNVRPHFPVLQHSFGPIAEWKDENTVGADGHLSGFCIQVRVGNRPAIKPAEPRIQDAGAVHAQQDSETGSIRRVIDMSEEIYAGLWIGLRAVRDSVNNSGCTRGRCHFTRFKDVQRKCVVGLIPGTICDGGPFFQSQLCCRAFCEATLFTERRHNATEDLRIDGKVFEKLA